MMSPIIGHPLGMRVTVIGATGNVGTALMRRLSAEPAVTELVGVSRRAPELSLPKTRWEQADISRGGDLVSLLRGSDAVVHLAWLIQPSRHEDVTRATNVEGSRRVFEAAAKAAVPRLLYASSVGAYAEGPKDRAVDESWPATGIATSFYSRHKAATEAMLDGLERAHPEIRIVRLRKGLIFGREAASGIRRLFAGPLLPSFLLRPSLIPVVPAHERLVFQAVHRDDVAEAYRLALLDDDARGAYNVAAGPVLDSAELARILGARPVPVPAGVLRAAADLTWRAHLQPTEPGWVDLGLGVPVMDIARARDELGWAPRHTASEALLELIDGMRENAGGPTPSLDPSTGGPARVREFLTGIGHTSK
ncbi:MAG: NAD-dependent epimerase/dehydratase family protein [Solirubrobacteraceae bacterium]